MFSPATLSNPSPIFSLYIPPDGDPITELTDVELGGIGLQDPSQGLQVQDWTLTIVPNGLNGDFYLSAPNFPSTLLFSRVNVTWGRLAFDQNMFPIISYVDQYGAGYYWYDPIAHAYAFVVMDPAVRTPCVTMDDKRPIPTLVGSNDVILAYMKGNGLYYRIQRERYGTEYLLKLDMTTLIPNPSLWMVGMNEGMRLQFLFHGNLYQ
jgi:hypothetical protein